MAEGRGRHPPSHAAFGVTQLLRRDGIQEVCPLTVIRTLGVRARGSGIFGLLGGQKEIDLHLQ